MQNPFSAHKYTILFRNLFHYGIQKARSEERALNHSIRNGSELLDADVAELNAGAVAQQTDMSLLVE